jgi:photosystem II stability/assembly factor-like uncharacterized protein
MNDEQLGRRLQDELHRRINPPDGAPEAVHEHVRSLRSMEEVRAAGPARRRGILRDLFALAAAVAIVALAAAGLLWRSSSQPAGRATPTAVPTRTFSWTPGPTAIDVTPTASTIERVERIDANSGWAAILRPNGSTDLVFTDDGGSTWSGPSQGTVVNPSREMEFLDRKHGWDVGEVGGTSPSPPVPPSTLTVSRTTDGGTTWQSSKVGVGTSIDQGGGFETLTVHFRDRQNGVVIFAYGSPADYTQPAEASLAPDVCEVFSTSDGGVTWSSPAAGLCLEDVNFVSSSVGYAYLWTHGPDIYSISTSPDFYVTSDGGQTWTRAQLPEGWNSPDSSAAIYFMQQRSDGTIRALCRCGPQTAQVSGGSAGVHLISSGDGGRTWTSLGSAQGLGGTQYWQVGSVSEDRWIAADWAGQTLFRTSDGGLTWQKLEPTGLPTGAEPREFSIWNGGWAIVTTEICGPESSGPACITATSTLYSTADGGQTWTPILTP